MTGGDAAGGVVDVAGIRARAGMCYAAVGEDVYGCPASTVDGGQASRDVAALLAALDRATAERDAARALLESCRALRAADTHQRAAARVALVELSDLARDDEDAARADAVAAMLTDEAILHQYRAFFTPPAP